MNLAIIEGFGHKRNMRMVELQLSRWVARAFFRPWTWLPYAWERYGVKAFGVGCIGFNILRTHWAAETPKETETP